MNRVQRLWNKLFEGSIVVGAVSVTLIFGVCVGWTVDRGPIYVENPDPAASFVAPNVIRAGEFIITSRSLRRLETCAVNVGVWIVTAEGTLLYPIGMTQAIARPDAVFRAVQVGYQSPAALPPGHYAIRSYPVCDRNPLVQVQQQLRDLPFEVVAP